MIGVLRWPARLSNFRGLQMRGKSLLIAFGGFLLGIASLAIVLRFWAPHLLFLESDSTHDFQTSVNLLDKAATENGWVIPKQYRLDISLKKAGHDVLPVSVIELCRPEHAAKILGDDRFRHFSTLMPCRVSVYEKSDGTVSIARMNTGLLSRLFDPVVAGVMAEATSETEHILDAITAQ